MTNLKTHSFFLPHIGQRITKTSIAVFITLLVYYLRGYRGAEMPAEAAITAIICMQPYVRDTRDFAVSRFLGSFIGAAWGLGFLFLLLVFPSMGDNLFLVYLRMSIGVMLTLYTCVVVHRPDTACQAAIVFVCVVISFPEIESPLQQAAERFSGVLLGTCSAIAVNVFRLPRDKKSDLVFFIRISDLVPDRFSRLPSGAHYRLNYLYSDGARICLMSEHAPAFFTMTMSETRLNTPFIVMDGAAIYDANTNTYLQSETIDSWESSRLSEFLRAKKISFFIYTLHNGRVCIFHQGPLREQEKVIYNRMRRSPYRNYLDGEIFKADEIVYIKIIDRSESILLLSQELSGYLNARKLRMVLRTESVEGISAIYIYSDSATIPLAEERLMNILRKDDPSLQPCEVFSDTPYRSEHDTLRLISRVSNLYEPLKLKRLFSVFRGTERE